MYIDLMFFNICFKELSQETYNKNSSFISVVLSIRFTDFYLEWTSPSDVFLFSDTTSSRLLRAVGSRLGVQKSMCTCGL